jgi:glycosyltransferase involved in cell wall biosynthesis
MKVMLNVPLRLVHCKGGAGLAYNVNNCFDHAGTEWVCLLHDDDLLMDAALEVMFSFAQQNPFVVGVFGKQRVIDTEGVEVPHQTLSVNRDHLRVGGSKLIGDGTSAGIFQMFPNDGYLIKTSLAREIRHDPKWGAASEVDFGIRLGQRGAFVFVDEFTASYRLSKNSITRGTGRKTDDCGYMLMKLLERAGRTGLISEQDLSLRMEDRVRIAIAQATNLGQFFDAWRWMWSRHHRKHLLSLGGLRRMASLIAASLKSAT